MEIHPLPKKIFNKAVSLGITEIHLNFSGGNDEGYLNVSFVNEQNEDFEREVTDWADTEYSYSGAGDGSDYGDDIVYNLTKKTVTSSSWYTARTEGETEEIKLKVSKK